MTDVATRRVRRRRSMGGLSSSTDGSGPLGYSNDEYDDEDDINEVVESRASSEPDVIGDDVAGGDGTPFDRLREVNRRSSGYEREYRLKLINRLLMRQVPLDQIAQQLQVSVRTVQRDRAEIHRRLREQAQDMDVFQMIGESTSFYEEVKGMAMRLASASKVPANMKVSAMRTALSANNDKAKFLQATGVFDVLRYRKVEKDANDDITRLMEMTEALINDSEDTPVEDILNGMGISVNDDSEDNILEMY